MSRNKDGKVIGTGTGSKGNVFQLNPTKMTFLVAKVDKNWLWHRIFCYINIDNIVKVSSTFAVTDFPKIIKPANVVCKECIWLVRSKYHFLARSSLPQRS